jgi:hypothetical protein
VCTFAAILVAEIKYFGRSKERDSLLEIGFEYRDVTTGRWTKGKGSGERAKCQMIVIQGIGGSVSHSWVPESRYPDKATLAYKIDAYIFT